MHKNRIIRNKEKSFIRSKDEIQQIIQYYQIFLTVLTSKRRKIWKYLQNFCISVSYVFLKVETIARNCKCSIRTVQYALKEFEAMGWLSRIIRAYQSSLYEIPDMYKIKRIRSMRDCEIIIKSLHKQLYGNHPPTNTSFLEENLHPVCSVLSLSPMHMNNNHDLHLQNGKNSGIFYILKKHTRLDEQEFAKFYRFSEYTLNESIREAGRGYHYYVKKGKKIDDNTRFLLSICWKKHKQHKEKIV